MQHRTLEEYKEEVFDKLDEQTKLEWLYEMSEKLCTIEEYIKDAITTREIVGVANLNVSYILRILNGGDEDEN